MKNRKTNVLLLEDDPAQYSLLSAYLEKENYRVLIADCIKKFKSMIKSESPDLVLLDLNLPDGDGLQLVKVIRSNYKIPLIIITSRDTMFDRLTGLELGADDYICKPYHPKELMIRIGKLLKNGEISDSQNDGTVKFNGFTFDGSSHRFYDENGEDISLTPGEYIIMTSLLEGRGSILSREQLVNAAFQRSEYPSDRTIDVLVSRLRTKFKIAGGKLEIIETVKGFGYRLNRYALK